MPLFDSILDRLPGAYRDLAKSAVTANAEEQLGWTKLPDEDLAAAIINQISRKPGNEDFLLAQLAKEPSPKVRSQIIVSLAPYWSKRPEDEAIIEHHAAADPDAGVAILALEVLRSTRMEELRKFLDARLAAAKSGNDTASLGKLGPEEEEWFIREYGVMLPFFLRTPPPVFSVMPANRTVRVLAFGDFGTGSLAQEQTAAAMHEYHKQHPFDFGLTLGDNFYPNGLDNTDDSRLKTQWEDLYGPMGIKFYATLGNHDWYGIADSPAAEILYSDKSPDWRLPSPYYSFTAGAVQFFAIDTVELVEGDEAQLQWLDSELAKSTARWKVVYGHYHIFSAGRGDNKALIERLLPVLEKNHVDVYLNGHDHNLQELKPEGGVHFFVSGGGGAALYFVNPYERSVYKQMVNGFTVLEADANHFTVKFIGIDGKELHTSTLTKP